VTTTQEEGTLVGQRRPIDGDDATLASRARAGDRRAFTVLLRRHDPTMRRLAYRMLADATAMDDVLQEAYVKAYTALPGYRDDSRFGTWLYRITYNACIDEIRRRRRRPAPAAEPLDVPSRQAGPERTVTAAETVRRTLADLPPDQRATVVLVDGEGFDHQTAARILGVAPGTVASRLSRARHTLRRSTEEVDR
jgi:RNA polymerase sigma-70 factor (ECF subfamily)